MTTDFTSAVSANAADPLVSPAPEADQFRENEVWESPRGFLYLCVGFHVVPGKAKQAVLRMGSHGKGRKVLRDWHGVTGWQRVDTKPSD